MKTYKMISLILLPLGVRKGWQVQAFHGVIVSVNWESLRVIDEDQETVTYAVEALVDTDE